MEVSTYLLHDTSGDDLGHLEHPAPNLEPGDLIMFADGREALVTARVEAEPRPLTALLEVVVVPQSTPRIASTEGTDSDS
jgi:hypothetical protein